jgi:hypothetical protein
MALSQILPADLAPHLGDTIVKLLAVLGGAVLGGLLIGAFAQSVVKLVTAGKRMPRAAHNLIRITGAVAVGLAIYFVLGPGGFGGLGWGLGGGGSGTGHTGTTQHGTGGTSTQQPTSPASQPETARPLGIEMLGGKRYKGSERFYLIVGAKEPVTFEEVRKTIEQRKQAKSPLEAIEIIIRDDDSVSEVDPTVAKLRRLAEDLSLRVTITTLKDRSGGF